MQQDHIEFFAAGVGKINYFEHHHSLGLNLFDGLYAEVEAVEVLFDVGQVCLEPLLDFSEKDIMNAKNLKASELEKKKNPNCN